MSKQKNTNANGVNVGFKCNSNSCQPRKKRSIHFHNEKKLRTVKWQRSVRFLLWNIRFNAFLSTLTTSMTDLVTNLNLNWSLTGRYRWQPLLNGSQRTDELNSCVDFSQWSSVIQWIISGEFIHREKENNADFVESCWRFFSCVMWLLLNAKVAMCRIATKRQWHLGLELLGNTHRPLDYLKIIRSFAAASLPLKPTKLQLFNVIYPNSKQTQTKGSLLRCAVIFIFRSIRQIHINGHKCWVDFDVGALDSWMN